MRYVNIKRMDGGIDRIAAYTLEEYPFFMLKDNSRRAKNKKFRYMDTFAVFDIETTTLTDTDPPEGFMYHWQMKIGNCVLYGRRWEEWIELMREVSEWLELSPEKRMVVYIHNAGYELQFIKDFLIKHFGELEIFASKARQPIYFLSESGFEFRCSSKLTNMKLEKACLNEYGVIHPKAAGDLDYTIRRVADTELSDIEFGYCISDVVSLYELIERRLINEGDTLDSIPLTSTGYVRRDCRAACRADGHYRARVFKKQLLTPDVYTLLKEEGRGGNTHANRYMSGRIWRDVSSYDEVSGYPAMLLLKKYPMSKFSYYGNVSSGAEFKKLLSENACLFRVLLENVKVRPEVTMPYIPSAKLLERGGNARFDNGRVLSCDWILLTVNDIDWEIITRQYEFSDVSISDFYIATYDYLPEPIRKTVLKYFYRKCELKNLIENCTDKAERDNYKYLYNKEKSRLNGIFGMMYTSPVRPKIVMDHDGKWTEEVPNIEEALEKYNNSRNSFLIYAWGAWTTSLNRKHLQTLLDITGDDTIYCDTDSSKAMINPRIRERIEAENDKIIKECEERGAYADIHGKRYYIGLYELDGEYDEFITLGAKKYAYTDKEGFHITVAGVDPKAGAAEMGDIKLFEPGYIFREAGGKTLYYNEADIHYITVDGCRMLTASNIGMVDSTYEIGITGEYAELIGYNIYSEIQ